MKTFNKFISLAFGLILVSGIATAQVKYRSSEGKISAKFPCDYEIENTGDSKTVKVKANCNNNLYYDSFIEHDENVEDIDGILQISIDAFSEKLEGSIKKQSDFTMKKHAGLQAEIDFAENTVLYRVLMSGKMQYQMISLGSSGNFDRAVAEDFFKSIKIK